MNKNKLNKFRWYRRDGTVIEDMKETELLLSDLNYKRVKETVLEDGKWISTVWLGLDHRFDYDKGEPLIFETMVFPEKGKYSELDMNRYATEIDALEGHEEMVKKWKNK